MKFFIKKISDFSFQSDFEVGLFFFNKKLESFSFLNEKQFDSLKSFFNGFVGLNESKEDTFKFFFENKKKFLYFVGLLDEKELQKDDFNDCGSECFFSINENLRNCFGRIIKFLEKNKLKNVNVFFDKSFDFFGIDKFLFFKIFSETFEIANYFFDEFLDESKKGSFVENVNIFLYENLFDDFLKIEENLNFGKKVGDSVNNARKWGDLPPSVFYPEIFAKDAENLLNKNENIKINILKKSELEKLGMNGVLGVCAGSIHDPRVFLAEYEPKNFSKTVVLVGKGVTFDTGGISIKPSDNMEDMKGDMGGAASVISAFHVLSQMKLDLRIIVCAPMVENMPSGSSLKPGDIIRFYGGKKTAEIKNTDAEGRLILADALAYVCEKYKPNFLIDLATLTGACSIALGPFYAALISRSKKLSNCVKEAGQKSGDFCWELPFNKMYEDAISSDVADICNISRRYCRAGTTTAGAFLSSFVDKDIKWVHVDIASVDMHPVGRDYYKPFGNVGFGVRLLVELISNPDFISLI